MAMDPVNKILKSTSTLLTAGIRTADNARLILNFLQGKRQFKPRASDIFVASYPRTGTTWMQFILYQMTTAGTMDFTHIGEVAPWYERSLSIGSMDADMFNAMDAPRILKTHLLPQWLPQPGKFIYLQRHVEDVVTSYYHFYRSHLQFTGSFDAFFERFLDGTLQYRSYFAHNKSWQSEHSRDVLTVAYEDLQQHFSATVSRIARFLDISLEDSVQKRIEAHCCFEAMKQHEDKFDHITSVLLERGYIRGEFIRSGAGGNLLSKAQKERLNARKAIHEPQILPETHIVDFLH